MLRFIDDSSDWVADAPHAIATMVVGDDYRAVWETACRPNWEAYAARHGLDLLVLTTLLDHSPRGLARSPAWQKLPIYQQAWAQQYERLVWIDADIVIAPNAPNILPCVPDPTKIGICRAGAQLSSAELHIYLERLYRTAILPEVIEAALLMHHRGQYVNAGLAPQDAPMLNTGVFVASPLHHQEILAEIYDGIGDSRLYEQPLFSQLLEARGLIQPFTPRFNWSVHEFITVNFPEFLGAPNGPAISVTTEQFDRFIHRLKEELQKSYFLHFSGSMPTLRLIANLERAHGFQFAA